MNPNEWEKAFRIVNAIDLHEKASKVVKITNSVYDLCLSLERFANKNNLIGLAANQLGIDLAVAVIGSIYKTEKMTWVINPSIESVSPPIDDGIEGCLSIPDVIYYVKRPRVARIKGIFLPNEKEEVVLFFRHDARVALHEVAHLNGHLISDYKTSRIMHEKNKST